MTKVANVHYQNEAEPHAIPYSPVPADSPACNEILSGLHSGKTVDSVEIDGASVSFSTFMDKCFDSRGVERSHPLFAYNRTQTSRKPEEGILDSTGKSVEESASYAESPSASRFEPFSLSVGDGKWVGEGGKKQKRESVQSRELHVPEATTRNPQKIILHFSGAEVKGTYAELTHPDGSVEVIEPSANGLAEIVIRDSAPYQITYYAGRSANGSLDDSTLFVTRHDDLEHVEMPEETVTAGEESLSDEQVEDYLNETGMTIELPEEDQVKIYAGKPAQPNVIVMPDVVITLPESEPEEEALSPLTLR